MDFKVNVNVKTHGKNVIDALEKQINALNGKQINLNVGLTGNGSNLVNSINSAITSAFGSGGSISNNIAKQIQNVGHNTGNQAKKIAKIQSDIFNGTYSAKSSSMTSKLSPYSNQNSKALEEARKQAKIYNDTLENLKKHFDSNDVFQLNDDEVVRSFETMDTAAKKFNNTMIQVRNSQSKDLGLGVAERSANSVKSYYEANTKALKKYGAELKDLEQRYRSIKTVEDKSLLDNEFKNLKSQISAEGLTGKSFLNELGRGFKQIAQFAGTYGLIQRVPEAIGQMFQEVRNVNASQIELTKVSDATANQLTAYWDEAAESAMKYGSTISDVISSTADWSRLGYSLKDAKQLSDATTLLQKVGDNMTQENSSQGLISTLRGFSMQVDEVGKIVDIANEVANTKPIDTAGIFEGLKRSASSMSTANNTLEETVALITAANSVVQDPASIGTSLKTLSMRIRGASTELQEAGLDTEGMAESVAKLREEILTLSDVDIMKDDNTFKSTYDILDELSTKWSDLTDIEQASVTELIAGKRQGNVISALMQNFDIARDTLKTALNESEGSAEKELENYQKGIEHSIEKFQAAFQKLSTTTFKSDSIKGAVDFGTDILNVLDAIIDKIGLLGAVGAGAGIVGLIKNFGNSNEFALYGCESIVA